MGQYVRRKSQSITSAKEIVSNQRKATQAKQPLKKKTSGEIKPKSLAGGKYSNLAFQAPMKSARGPTTPQHKPGLVSKIPAPKNSSTRLPQTELKKEKKDVAIKLQEPVGLLHTPEPIDLTPSPLAMGPAGETIENMLPR